jgi:hypothetical protein
MYAIHVSLLFILIRGGSVSFSGEGSKWADLQVLGNNGLSDEGLSLLEFFRQRTVTNAGERQAAELVRELGDRSFPLREKAAASLIKLGVSAEPMLLQALKATDPEVQRRARYCLDKITSLPRSRSVVAAAMRSLAWQRPPGSAAVLLDYLPMVEDRYVEHELRDALSLTARSAGKIEPALLQALTNSMPRRRAAAGEALARIARADCKDAVLKLLRDPQASVRLRVALGLLQAKAKEAVPVLIRCLADLPHEEGWEAEEALHRLGVEERPAIFLSRDNVMREKVRDAWHSWWLKHRDSLDLTVRAASDGWRGVTLVVEGKPNPRIVALDSKGNILWRIEGRNVISCAQMVDDRRVLIGYGSVPGIVEATIDGKRIWGKDLRRPFASVGVRGLQLTATGDLFFSNSEQLVEMDRNGKEKVLYQTPRVSGFGIQDARKLKTGYIAIVTSDSMLRWLDSDGKELKGFKIPSETSIAKLDALDDGRVVIGLFGTGKVLEYDINGKLIWEVRAKSPTSVQRLPNGNTLIASQSDRSVIEIDRAGKEVWRYKSQSSVHFATRR